MDNINYNSFFVFGSVFLKGGERMGLWVHN